MQKKENTIKYIIKDNRREKSKERKGTQAKQSTSEEQYGTILVFSIKNGFLMKNSIPRMTHDLTSTMILQGPNQKNYSDIFVDQSFQQEKVAISKFTHGELSLRLRRYLSILETAVM